MNVSFPNPGRYVVAVSGGVDSMVLLHLLHQNNENAQWQLIVAHYDHGMRPDAADDRNFVAEVAQQYGLPFVFREGRLGAQASEAVAREARYAFLHEVRLQHEAEAILTAHHEDDVIETAIINLLRGTGRKGITALADQPLVKRPLLCVPKRALISYAQAHDVTWREDSTNTDQQYLRNYVRHSILPRFDERGRRVLLKTITDLRTTNTQLDSLLSGILENETTHRELDRRWFSGLPHPVAREVMAAWLRAHDTRGFDRKTLERLVVGAKTGRTGSKFNVIQGTMLVVTKEDLALVGLER